MVFLHWLAARLSALFWRTDTTPALIVSGMTLSGWSIILLSTNVFDARNLYDYLSNVASAHVWAVVTGILGAAQLVKAFVFAESTFAYHLRLCVWIAAGVFWLYITSVAVLAVPVTTVAATAAVLAIGCFWGLIRESER